MSGTDRWVELACTACGFAYATQDLSLIKQGLCSSCDRKDERMNIKREDRMTEPTTAIAPVAAITDEAMWQLIASGDLKGLTAKQKSEYYLHLCNSLGMNPATQPFEYLTLNNKLVLYAKKAATDQLREIRGVSVEGMPRITDDGEYISAEVMVRDREGRTDFDLGVVYAGALKGEARANAKMKALTKAKRRATLSVCGLGMLDETEVETIPGAYQAAPRSFPVRIEPEDESQEPLNSEEDMEEALPPDPPKPVDAVVKAFADIGVTRGDLESFLQRDLVPGVALPEDEKVALRRIHKEIASKKATWSQVVEMKNAAIAKALAGA